MKRTIDDILWPAIGIGLGLICFLSLFGDCRANAAETTTPVCLHEWVKGPFWIKAAITWEEPEYYAPQGIINIEHCVQCGLIRIPKDLKSKRGKNLRDGPATWTTGTNAIDGTSLTNLLRLGDGLVITNTGSNVLIILTNRPRADVMSPNIGSRSGQDADTNILSRLFKAMAGEYNSRPNMPFYMHSDGQFSLKSDTLNNEPILKALGMWHDYTNNAELKKLWKD